MNCLSTHKSTCTITYIYFRWVKNVQLPWKELNLPPIGQSSLTLRFRQILMLWYFFVVKYYLIHLSGSPVSFFSFLFFSFLICCILFTKKFCAYIERSMQGMVLRKSHMHLHIQCTCNYVKLEIKVSLLKYMEFWKDRRVVTRRDYRQMLRK